MGKLQSFKNGHAMLCDAVVGWQFGVAKSVDAWSVDSDQYTTSCRKHVNRVWMYACKVARECLRVAVRTGTKQYSWRTGFLHLCWQDQLAAANLYTKYFAWTDKSIKWPFVYSTATLDVMPLSINMRAEMGCGC